MIAENIERIQNHIRDICLRCNRRSEDIRILAVSKTWSPAAIREAWQAGIQDFGENYVQEFRTKRAELADLPIRWHFIGHLQSNKVKYIIETVQLIHTVDDEPVAKEIDKRAVKVGKVQDVLVEVHTTNEATKYGVKPEQTLALIKNIARLQNIRVCGLMTMGPFADDPEASRPSFQLLRELKEQIEKLGIENVSMHHLSMGMSHDYAVAIEEGATLLRIGTAIFGKREQPHA